MFNWIKSLFTPHVIESIMDSFNPAADCAAGTKTEVEHPNFANMTKAELDDYAKDKLNLKLDRRKTKDYMIEQIQKHLNKEN